METFDNPIMRNQNYMLECFKNDKNSNSSLQKRHSNFYSFSYDISR